MKKCLVVIFISLFIIQSFALKSIVFADSQLSIQANVEYTNNLQSYNEQDRFDISISKPSSIQIRFKHIEIKANCSWHISVYSSEGEEIIKFYSLNNDLNILSVKARLAVGSYYIKVKSGTWNSSDYNITAIVIDESIGNYEKEDNDMKSYGQTIGQNLEYTGNIQDYLDDDFFKLDISKPSSIQIRFKHIEIKANCGWQISLYSFEDDEEFIIFYSSNKDTNMLSVKARLAVGSYYIKIRATTWNSSDYNITAKVVDESKGNYEKEDNDMKSYAQTISQNLEYTGNLQDYNDNDFYKFTLKKASSIQLRFRHAEVKSNCGWEINFYSSKDKELIDFHSRKNDINMLSAKVKLSVGTYYIKVKPDSTWNSIDYKVSANIAGKSSNANLSKITCSTGILSPNFKPTQLSYNLKISSSKSSVKITAYKDESHATIYINGKKASYINVYLSKGKNKDVSIKVVAENGFSKIYKIKVSRNSK